MKKIWNRILRWWYFGVCNITRKKTTVGGFTFKFKNYDLIIGTVSNNFELRVRATEFMFGYLAAALAQNKTDQLHGYAAMMYIMAGNIAKDAKFNKEINRAIEGYVKRQSALKESEQISEEAAIAMEKSDMAVAKMSRRERRAHKREVAKIVRKEMANQNKVKDNDEK